MLRALDPLGSGDELLAQRFAARPIAALRFVAPASDAAGRIGPRAAQPTALGVLYEGGTLVMVRLRLPAQMHLF